MVLPHSDPWGCSHATRQGSGPHRRESSFSVCKEGFSPSARASDAKQLSANDVKGGRERVQGPQATLPAFFWCLASLPLSSGHRPKLSWYLLGAQPEALNFHRKRKNKNPLLSLHSPQRPRLRQVQRADHDLSECVLGSPTVPQRSSGGLQAGV